MAASIAQDFIILDSDDEEEQTVMSMTFGGLVALAPIRTATPADILAAHQELSIAQVVAARQAAGQTFQPPEIPPESWAIVDQTRDYAPCGWRECFAAMADEFAFIEGNLRKKFPGTHCPHPPSRLFAAFHYTPLEHIKVVLMGQDPYPDLTAATGLCFSMPATAPIRDSIKNIFTELEKEYPGFRPYNGPDLTHWAQQGVLLLNQSLTCSVGKSASHGGLWLPFLDIVVSEILEKAPKAIFVLWGRDAQKRIGKMIGGRAARLESAHPSPLSAWAGFLGNGHFRMINEHLVKTGQTPIKW